jgi:phenylacetate-CoA ligase
MKALPAYPATPGLHYLHIQLFQWLFHNKRKDNNMENLTGKKPFFDEERETMAWGKRKDRLNARFLATFRHAFERSKAYREIYESAGIQLSDIKGLDDIEKLPLLHMSDLAERQKVELPFGGFNTVDSYDVRRIYVNPGMIWQPGEWDYNDTSWAEALCAAGFGEKDRVINTFSYGMWPFAFMLDESVKRIGAAVIPTGIGNTLMQVKIMQQLKANGFMGTPSFIMTLLQRVESMGLDIKKDLALETAVVSAEMLPESLRSRIQDKAEIAVRQLYGNVFLGCIGYECQFLRGLHVPDNMLVEIVNPETGKQVEAGAAGEIVATNFNTAYPMIRMATGDLSMLTRESCLCGRTGPILKKILGRIDQATTVRGTFVHPWQADEVISRYPEVYKYQVVVTRKHDKDVMTFVVELSGDVHSVEVLRARIERDIKDMLTIRGDVQVVERGALPDFHKKIEDKRSWE